MSMQIERTIRVVTATVLLAVGCGCWSISITPQCPAALDIGESGVVRAQATNTGPFPIYSWEVVPASAGTLGDSSLPVTQFSASEPGHVILRLTASDGMFQVISECGTRIIGTPQVVLTASVEQASTGDTITLTCTDTGSIESLAKHVSQTDGPMVTLSAVSEGIASFTPTTGGSRTFACVGEGPSGDLSDASTVTVTVTADASGADDNVNDNQDDNTDSSTGGGRR